MNSILLQTNSTILLPSQSALNFTFGASSHQCFFSSTVQMATTFLFSKCPFCEHFFIKFSEFPQHARFARTKTVWKCSARLGFHANPSKNTLMRLSVRRYENQKTFPPVFSLLLSVSPRAARRNFRFCRDIFLLKRSQSEDRSV